MNDRKQDRRDEELDRLFGLARQDPPDLSGVEPGFESRVMERIREAREPWHAWAWRLVPAFLALTVLLVGWTLFFSPAASEDPGAMLASGSQEIALIDYLTGE